MCVHMLTPHPLQDIDQGMLPEACLQQVEKYRDRVVYHKERRRKSCYYPSPKLILEARGEHVFPDDTPSDPPLSSTTSTSSPSTTNSRSASNRANGNNKQKRRANSSLTNEELASPPLKKKRPNRKSGERRAAILSDGSGSVHALAGDPFAAPSTGLQSQDDMMQMTEQFAQQHFRNLFSQVTPALMATLPLVTQQQLAANYTPTSHSWMGIPILIGPSVSTSLATQDQPPSAPFTLPTSLMRPPATRVTSPSHSMTSQTQASPIMSQIWASSELQLPQTIFPLPAHLQNLPQMQSSLPSLSCSRASDSSVESLQSFPVSANSLSLVPHPDNGHPSQTRASALSNMSTSHTVTSQGSSHITCTASVNSIEASLTSICDQSSKTISVLTPSAIACTTCSTEVSQSPAIDSTQVPRTECPPVSTKKGTPTEEVMFPKGPHFITLVKRPESVAFLKRQRTLHSSITHPNSNTVSPRSYVQPHASLLAPGSRRRYISSFVDTGSTSSSVHDPLVAIPSSPLTSSLAKDPGSPASSPLNLANPVSAAVSALLSLSDHSDSCRLATSSLSPRMSHSPLRTSLRLANLSAVASERSTVATANKTSELFSSAATTVMVPSPTITIATSSGQTGTATHEGHGTCTCTVVESHTPYKEAGHVQVMAVPNAGLCSENLLEDSKTMKLSQEQMIALQKVDGPSLIGTTDTIDDVDTSSAGFIRGASIENDAFLYQQRSSAEAQSPLREGTGDKRTARRSKRQTKVATKPRKKAATRKRN